MSLLALSLMVSLLQFVSGTVPCGSINVENAWLNPSFQKRQTMFSADLFVNNTCGLYSGTCCINLDGTVQAGNGLLRVVGDQVYNFTAVRSDDQYSGPDAGYYVFTDPTTWTINYRYYCQPTTPSLTYHGYDNRALVLESILLDVPGVTGCGGLNKSSFYFSATYSTYTLMVAKSMVGSIHSTSLGGHFCTPKACYSDIYSSGRNYLIDGVVLRFDNFVYPLNEKTQFVKYSDLQSFPGGTLSVYRLPASVNPYMSYDPSMPGWLQSDSTFTYLFYDYPKLLQKLNVQFIDATHYVATMTMDKTFPSLAAGVVFSNSAIEMTSGADTGTMSVLVSNVTLNGTYSSSNWTSFSTSRLDSLTVLLRLSFDWVGFSKVVITHGNDTLMTYVGYSAGDPNMNITLVDNTLGYKLCWFKALSLTCIDFAIEKGFFVTDLQQPSDPLFMWSLTGTNFIIIWCFSLLLFIIICCVLPLMACCGYSKYKRPCYFFSCGCYEGQKKKDDDSEGVCCCPVPYSRLNAGDPLPVEIPKVEEQEKQGASETASEFAMRKWHEATKDFRTEKPKAWSDSVEERVQPKRQTAMRRLPTKPLEEISLDENSD